MPFVITAGAIIFESFMNICYTLSHVRLTQGFVILLLTIQIIRRATCSNNTGSTISVFLNKAKGTSPLYVTGPSLFLASTWFVICYVQLSASLFQAKVAGMRPLSNK